MKNLFLTSTFEEVSHLFKEFEKSETRVKKVTFIPTASVCEEVIFYVDAGREALEGLGLIVEQINLGKTYIGESAGSVILAADIEYISEMDAPEVANNLDSFDALDVIDFFPLPHYTNNP
jgi:dipeptidase E